MRGPAQLGDVAASLGEPTSQENRGLEILKRKKERKKKTREEQQEKPLESDRVEGKAA